MVDHSFDHLASRTTWKQCEREHPKASFSDLKVLKSLVNQGKNRCRFVWAVNAAGSNPVTPAKIGFGKQFPKPFSLFPPTQILRADDCFSSALALYIIPTNWNLSNTDDLSYFLSIIVAVVYGKFAVIQFWQNL